MRGGWGARPPSGGAGDARRREAGGLSGTWLCRSGTGRRAGGPTRAARTAWCSSIGPGSSTRARRCGGLLRRRRARSLSRSGWLRERVYGGGRGLSRPRPATSLTQHTQARHHHHAERRRDGHCPGRIRWGAAEPALLTDGRAARGPRTHEGPGLPTGPFVVERGGGGGNRTRVLRRISRASPSAVRYCLCSTPSISRTSRCDGPSRCEMSRERPRPALTVSHLADARIRADDEPGLTESPRYLGSEGELALTGVGACVVSNAWLTSSSLASSARFPWTPDRSRDQSPPVQLCSQGNGPVQPVVPGVLLPTSPPSGTMPA